MEDQTGTKKVVDNFYDLKNGMFDPLKILVQAAKIVPGGNGVDILIGTDEASKGTANTTKREDNYPTGAFLQSTEGITKVD